MGTKNKKKTKGPTIALHLPSDPQELYTHCSASWGAIKADTTNFKNPPAGVDDDLEKLGKALFDAAGKDPVAITEVHTTAEKVRQTFGLLGKYVQVTLRALPIEDAPAIIANVLMYESKVGQRAPKLPLEAKRGASMGLVRLIALAVPSASVYFWEYSLDQATWVAGAQSAQANATIAGLTPGKLYYFRFHVFTRQGVTTDPSHAISYTVT